MGRRNGAVKRCLAFLLSLALMLGNVNVGTARAAVLDSEDVSDIIDISHTLTESGTAAIIQVTEASPNVRIRNVKMVGGHVVVASDANASQSEMNGCLTVLPNTAEPGQSDPAKTQTTQAGPGTVEPAAANPDNAAQAAADIASPPDTEYIASLPDADYIASPPDADHIASPSDAIATPPDATVSDQFSNVYTFLVNENRNYRFRVTYEVEQHGYTVRNTVTVNYRVDDIGGVTFIGAEDETIDQGDDFNLLENVRAINEDGENLDSLTVKDDGGFQNELPGAYQVLYAAVNPHNNLEFTKERTISVKSSSNLTLTERHDDKYAPTELPVDAKINGTLTVSYNLPDKTGRYLDVAFPKYAEDISYPSDDKIDVANSGIVNPGDHRYTVRLAIKDGVSGTLKIDFSYTDKIYLNGLNADELMQYRKDGRLVLGSFLAEAKDGPGGPVTASAEIGPITTARNTIAPRLDRAFYRQPLGETLYTPDFFNIMMLQSEKQRLGFYSSGWAITDEWNSVTAGYIPPNYRSIKIYAPTNFAFHIENVPDGDRFMTLGADPDGSDYLIFDCTEKDFHDFHDVFQSVYLQQKPGTTLQKDTTYEPPRDTVVTYGIWDGPDKTAAWPKVCNVWTDHSTFVKGDVFKVQSSFDGVNETYPNCAPIYPGRNLVDYGLIATFSNNGTYNSRSQFGTFAQDDAANTKVTVTLPYEVEGTKILSLTGDARTIGAAYNPFNDESYKAELEPTADVVVTDRSGATKTQTVPLVKMTTSYPNVFSYTLDLSGLKHVTKITFTIKTLYQAMYTLKTAEAEKSALTLAQTQQDGSPFETDPAKPGNRIHSSIKAVYNGKTKLSSSDRRAKSALTKDIFEYNTSTGPITLYPGEASTLQGNINNGMLTKTSDSADNFYTLPSHHAEGAVLKFDYPYEFQPTKWTFLPQATLLDMGDRLDRLESMFPLVTEDMAQASVGYVEMTLKSTNHEPDQTMRANLSYLQVPDNTPKGCLGWKATADNIPKGYYVASAELHLSSLYLCDYQLTTSYTVPTAQADGSPVTAGNETMAIKLSYTDENHVPQEKDTNIPMIIDVPEDGTLVVNSIDTGSLLVQKPTSVNLLNITGGISSGADNPALSITGHEYLDLLDGSYTGAFPVGGWEIRYTTSAHRQGTYQIPMTADDKTAFHYVHLLPGETITGFTLAKSGYTNLGAGFPSSLRLGCTIDPITLFDMKPDPSAPHFGTLEGSYEYTSDSQKTPLSQTVTGKILKSKDSLFNCHRTYDTPQALTLNDNKGSAYQGEVIPVKLYPSYFIPDKINDSVLDGILPVGDIDYYIEWTAPSYITFSGLGTDDSSDDRYQANLIKNEDGKTYLKISPKHPGLENWKLDQSHPYPGQPNYCGQVTDKPIMLDLYALPGSAAGATQIFGKTYADIKKYGEEAEEVLRQSGLNLTIQDAVPDSGGICGDGDITSNRLFLLDDQDHSLQILQNALTGVQILLGKDGQYSSGQMTFTPYQKDNLNALLSVSNDLTGLKNYTIDVEIPRKGKEINYLGGVSTVSKITSQFDLFLRGPAQCGCTDSYSLLYRMTGQDDYITEAQVAGKWNQVDALRLTVPSMSANQSFTLALDLSTTEKLTADMPKAYIAASYSYEDDSLKHHGALTALSTFIYGNYAITGNAWYDANEDGVRDGGETPLSGVRMELWKDKELLGTTATDDHGRYSLQTYLADGLSVKTYLPDEKTMVMTRPHAKEASAITDSDFDRADQLCTLDSKITASQSNIDAGFVYLPALTANDVKVMVKNPVPSDAHVTVPAGGLTPSLNFEEAADPAVAHVDGSGTITGKTVGGTTTASVWVVNTLGDRVDASYQIHVLDNDTLQVTAHDWTVIQGDTVSDWWDGVTYKTKLPSLLSKLLPFLFKTGDYTKTLTFHTKPDAGPDSQVTEDYVMSHPGTFYIRYRMEDDKSYGTTVAALTVYGALQEGTVKTLHFAPNAGTVLGDSDMFRYENADGTASSVPPADITPAPSAIPTDTGIYDIVYTAVHPMIGHVTASGVTPGVGRTLAVTGKACTDSSPVLTGLTNRTAKPTEVMTGLLDGVGARYEHPKPEAPHGSLTDCTITLSGPDGLPLADGTYTAPAEPGDYTLTYTANTNQTYDNGENVSTGTIKVTVVGTVVLTAPDTVYTVPEKSSDKAHIDTLIGASAYYVDMAHSGSHIPLTPDQIHYTYQKNGDGAITSVQAEGQYTTKLGVLVTSDPKTVTVTVRDIPKVTADPVHLRVGDPFDPSAGVTLTPSDPDHNTWTADPPALVTDTVGKQTVRYTAEDSLTQAKQTTDREVYVHGLPTLTVRNPNVTLYTQESTSADDLIAAVKAQGGISASVTYATDTPDSPRVVPLTDVISYAVDDGYTHNKAGNYAVTLTVSDHTALDPSQTPGLAESSQSVKIYVTVSDQIFHIQLTVNDPAKGLLGDGETDTKSVIYDNTMTDLLTPNAKDGYHFNGYKTLADFKSGSAVTLTDGTRIPAGQTIPKDSMITGESVGSMKIRADAQLQAFFSASPVIAAKNIRLYQGDSYDVGMLGASVSDLDADDRTLPIAYDSQGTPVDTAKTGTYQVTMTVTDHQANTTISYAYVQVYGKTGITVGETSSINWRQGTAITRDRLLSGITASYEDPPAIPTEPWGDHGFEPSRIRQLPQTELSVTIPDTNAIRLVPVDITAPGGRTDDAASGEKTVTRKLYIHGNPVITAYDNRVYTHLADDGSLLINTVKDGQGLSPNTHPASASVIYVDNDGNPVPTPIAADKIHYELTGFTPHTPGPYVVKMTVSDESVAGSTDAGPIAPVTGYSQSTVTVITKHQTVTLSVNSETKGGFSGDSPNGYSFQPSYGGPVGMLPQAPVPKPGYKLDGFRVVGPFVAGSELTPINGPRIPAGQTIPADTMLKADDVEGMTVVADMKLEAYFSAPPTVTARSVKLYEGDTYDRFMLDIQVSDLDSPGLIPAVDDSSVDTSKPGTYQVKISVTDPDHNNAATYAYVQVYGKSHIIFQGDHNLNTRQGRTLTQADLVRGVAGTYEKPADIPAIPWSDDQKSVSASPAPITVTATTAPDTDSVRRDTIDLMAQGQIRGQESGGRTTDSRYLYIHGLPTIVAYDNALYTHQSTGADALVDVIKNGGGRMGTQRASAYVNYVKTDGTIQTVPLSPDRIKYRVLDYTPLTQGSFVVEAAADDADAVASAEISGIPPVQGTAHKTVAVADKIYTVTLTTGEHGSFTGGATTVQIPTVHGRSVIAPGLDIEYGYKVDQWTDEAGHVISDINTYPITADQSIHVSFKLKEYVVKFYGRGDRMLSTQIVKHGYDAVPPTDDRDVLDKKFDGWSRSYKHITSDTNIYALYLKQTGPSIGGGGSGGGPGPGTGTGTGSGSGSGSGTASGSGIPDAVIPPPIQIQDEEVPLSGPRPAQHLDTEGTLRAMIRHLSVKAELTGGKEHPNTTAGTPKPTPPASANQPNSAPAETAKIQDNKVPAASLPKYVARQTKRSLLLIPLLLALLALAIYLLFKKRRKEDED